MHNAHILLEIHTISLTDSLLLLQKKASGLLLYLWAMLMDVKEDWNILNQRRPVTTNQDMDAYLDEHDDGSRKLDQSPTTSSRKQDIIE